MDIWEYFVANAAENERFSNAMTELTGVLTAEIAELLDTTGVGVAVDVGGANGALLRSNAGMRGVVLDLPSVEATAVAEAEKAGCASAWVTTRSNKTESLELSLS